MNSDNKRLREILNRKPSRWGNVSVKTFQQDILLLTDTVRNQEKEIHNLKRELKELRQNSREEGSSDV